jgi:hypothetical protein
LPEIPPALEERIQEWTFVVLNLANLVIRGEFDQHLALRLNGSLVRRNSALRESTMPMNRDASQPGQRKDLLMARAWLALLLITFLACEARNPILGSWTVDADRSPPGSASGLKMSGATDLEFLEGRMVAGSSSLDVTYIVEKGRVTVTTMQGQGTVYDIRSDHEISVETPMGPIIFRRVE